MRKLTLVPILLFFGTLLFSCGQPGKKKTETPPVTGADTTAKAAADSVLLTASSWGAINASTDFEGLKALYGKGNVLDERICGPECADSFNVTTVYPGSNKAFTVYWEDSFYHRKIMMIRCFEAGAPYHTADGLKLGSTLREVLQVNGKPITFTGFGWDYGGTITALNHGKLEGGNIRFNIDLVNENGDHGLYGDQEFSSGDPKVQKYLDQIRVSEIFLPFDR